LQEQVARRKKGNNFTRLKSRPDSVAASLVEKNWYIDFKLGTNSKKRKEKWAGVGCISMIISDL